MPFALNEVVPWGRSCDEYMRMFALTGENFKHSILGCGDGPASFNAEWTRRGGRVISVDPLYQFRAAQIEHRIAVTQEEVLKQTEANKDHFLWDTIGSVEALGTLRLAAMRVFLRDYPAGGREGRYVAAALPALPFHDRQFDLALCSHFLFLYSRQRSLEFHRLAVAEICRIAEEVRIFPLHDLDCEISPHLAPIISELQARGYSACIERVLYEFRRGDHSMLRIRRQ